MQTFAVIYRDLREPGGDLRGVQIDGERRRRIGGQFGKFLPDVAGPGREGPPEERVAGFARGQGTDGQEARFAVRRPDARNAAGNAVVEPGSQQDETACRQKSAHRPFPEVGLTGFLKIGVQPVEYFLQAAHRFGAGRAVIIEVAFRENFPHVGGRLPGCGASGERERQRGGGPKNVFHKNPL